MALLAEGSERHGGSLKEPGPSVMDGLRKPGVQLLPPRLPAPGAASSKVQAPARSTHAAASWPWPYALQSPVPASDKQIAETEAVTQPSPTPPCRRRPSRPPFSESTIVQEMSSIDAEAPLEKSMDSDNWDDEESIAGEFAAEPGDWADEPKPMSQTLCAALVLVVARLAWRVQRESLHQWQQVARNSLQPAPEPPRIEVSDVIAGVQEALARRSASLALERWRRRAKTGRAREAVRVFCDGYRSQVLVTRSFTIWANQAQRFLVASENAERLRERWSHAKLYDLIDMAMEAWRHRASSSSLRRRGEKALVHWINSSRLRTWAHGWILAARRSREVRQKLQRRKDVQDYQIGLRFVNAWRRTAGLWRLTRRRGEMKARRQALVAWRAWWVVITRSRRAALAASRWLMRRRGKLVQAWGKLHVAVEASTHRMIRSSFKCWGRMRVVLQVYRRMSLDHFSRVTQHYWMEWKKRLALLKRADRVCSRRDAARIQSTLRRWAQLRIAEHMGNKSIARSCLRVWRLHVMWCARVRTQIHSQEHSSLVEGFHHWAEHCRSQQRGREQETSLVEQLQHSQGSHRCVSAMKRWHQFASQRRAWTSNEHTCVSQVRDQIAARALWTWRGWTETHIDHREQLHRASLTLRAMLSTSEWATRNEACRFWSTWAKNRRKRRRLKESQRRREALGPAVEEFTNRLLWEFGLRFLRRWRTIVSDSKRFQRSFVEASTQFVSHRRAGALMHWAHWTKCSRQRRRDAGSRARRPRGRSRQARPEQAPVPRTSSRPRSASGTPSMPVRAAHFQWPSVADRHRRTGTAEDPWLAGRHRRNMERSRNLLRSSSCSALDASADEMSSTMPTPITTTTPSGSRSQSALGSRLTSHTGSPQSMRLRGGCYSGDVRNPALSTSLASTTAYYDRGNPEVELRWLRWTIALWLGAVAALPWLQWSFKLWRGALLRAELMRLRWWSMAMRRGAMQQIHLRRFQRPMVAWSTAASQAREAAAQKPSTPSFSAKHDSLQHVPPPRSTKQHSAERRAEKRYERISEAAWQGRLQLLNVFVAWSGWAQRSATLHRAVGRPDLCKVEFVLCAFSAWVVLTRRSRDSVHQAHEATLGDQRPLTYVSSDKEDGRKRNGDHAAMDLAAPAISRAAFPELLTRGGSAGAMVHL